MYNEITVNDLTIHCLLLFFFIIIILDEIAKHNEKLSNLPDAIKKKESELQKITGNYSNKNFYYGKFCSWYFPY
jgi:hypothetical protein